MQRIFELLLRLYPADYRAVFGAEMLSTFDRTTVNRHGRRFLLQELAGLLTGAGREWAAKLTTSAAERERFLSQTRGECACALPVDVVEAQRRIAVLIERMVYAIAHHDFAGARKYSCEEREEREKLRVLRGKYGIAE